MVRHFLHVFAYIPLTRVQLFIDKPRPFAQIETDAGAHVQIFTLTFGNRGFKHHVYLLTYLLLWFICLELSSS